MHLTLGILRQSQAVFYALSFFWLDGFAVPAPAQVTQTVGWQRQRANAKPSLIRKFRFCDWLRNSKPFFSGGVSSSSRLFVLSAFISLAKFLFGFIESLKLASRFFACVSVCGGFDWLCFVASVLFVVGFVGFQNRRIFFSQSFG